MVSQALVVATGVSIDGSREVLGTAMGTTARSLPVGEHLLAPQHRRSLHLIAGEHTGRRIVGDTESFQFWREFFASLEARGLSGVQLVISDAHAGLKAAVAQQFTNTTWQRCRVHFMRNLRGVVSSKQTPVVTAAVKTILAHTEPADIEAQWDQVADTLEASFPKVTTMMREAITEVLTFTAFPKAHWQKIWSNNPIERLNKEVKRRADVVEIFPNSAAFLRLATAVVIEAHDEWQVTRRYLSDVSMIELQKVVAAKQHAAALLDQSHQIG